LILNAKKQNSATAVS